VRILVRADSGFAREELMVWCEAHGVNFLFGLVKNDRLIAETASELAWAERRADGPASRRGTSRTSGGMAAGVVGFGFARVDIFYFSSTFRYSWGRPKIGRLNRPSRVSQNRAAVQSGSKKDGGDDGREHCHWWQCPDGQDRKP
jgi:hypothetical protein